MKLKFIVTILLSILILFNINQYSNAKMDPEKIFQSADEFIKLEDPNNVVVTPKEEEIKELTDMVSGILLTIAVAVTAISVFIMGINFMIESVEDKAKIKESMIPWVIGIFISFSAYGIWKVTMGIFYQMS